MTTVIGNDQSCKRGCRKSIRQLVAARKCEAPNVYDLRRVFPNLVMEVGSDRISTPIRAPSDKDSVILSRASGSSSPFGFRKVRPRARSNLTTFYFEAQHCVRFKKYFVHSQAALSPPTGILRRESSGSLSPEGDDFFHSVEGKDDEEDWDTDLELDGR